MGHLISSFTAIFELVLCCIQKFSSLKTVLQPAHQDHHISRATATGNVWKFLHAKWKIINTVTACIADPFSIIVQAMHHNIFIWGITSVSSPQRMCVVFSSIVVEMSPSYVTM